jgi:hypothetical protein
MPSDCSLSFSLSPRSAERPGWSSPLLIGLIAYGDQTTKCLAYQSISYTHLIFADIIMSYLKANSSVSPTLSERKRAVLSFPQTLTVSFCRFLKAANTK